MADMLGEAYVQVRADMKGLRPDLGRAGQEIRGFFSSLSAQVSGILPFASLAGGIAAAVNEFRKATAAAGEQADADRRLEQVLVATEHAAGISGEAMREHAAALQDSLGVADDAVMNFQSTLMTFRNVQGEVFKEATDRAVVMSVVMGRSLGASAIQLGRALQDPLTGMNSLKRMGVMFSDSQKEQIKQFMKTGQGAKAQKVILDQLGRQFGTVAELAKKMGSEPHGALKILNAHIEDLRESLGNELIPFQLFAAKATEKFVLALTAGMKIINKAIKGFQDLDKYLDGYLSTAILAAGATMALAFAFPYVTAAAGLAFGAIQTMLLGSGWGVPIVALGAIAGGLALLVKWLSTLEPIQKAWAAAVVEAERAWLNISHAAGVAFTRVSEAIASLMEIMGLGDLAATWESVTTGLADAIVATTVEMIGAIAEFVVDASEWAVVLAENWDLVWKAITLGGEYLISRLYDLFNNFTPFIVSIFVNVVDTIMQIWYELPTVITEVVMYLQEQFQILSDFIMQSMQNAVTTAIKVFYHLPGALAEITEYIGKLFAKVAADITTFIVEGAMKATRMALVIWQNYGKAIVKAIAGKSTEAETEAAKKVVAEARKAKAKADKDMKDRPKKETSLEAIKNDLMTAALRQKAIMDEALTRAGKVPLGKSGLMNIWEIAGKGMDRAKDSVEDLLAPSGKSKGIADAMFKALGGIVLEKMGMEAKRGPLPAGPAADAAAKAAKKKFDPGKLDFSTGKARKEVEGFFGPEELAKKLQEAMLKDSKTDKLIETTEAGVAVEEDMLTAMRDIHTTLKASPPISIATV
jgi:hypothetical protein